LQNSVNVLHIRVLTRMRKAKSERWERASARSHIFAMKRPPSCFLCLDKY